MKIKQSFILGFLVLMLIASSAKAQRAYPDSVSSIRLTTVVAAESVFYVAGMSYLQFIWYKDSKRVPLHFYDDSQGWSQIDKAGHAFSAYYESYIGYHALRWAGVSKTKALIFGGPLGLFLQTPIEIFDGIYDSWGFSPTDMIANTAGPVLFTVQQAIWDEQIVRMKISYSPSPYAPHRPAYFGTTHAGRFFHDYNGHTYWLSANINRIVPALHSPKWLNLAVGYSANGMLGEFANPEYSRGVKLPEFERYRQYLLSFDIDLSRIPTKKRWLRTLFNTINIIKIPAPALEYNRVQKFTLKPLYF